MSLDKLVDELGVGLRSEDGRQRAEAISAFCRMMMIEGEVTVPREALDMVAFAACSDDDGEVRGAAADFLCWTTEWTDTRLSEVQVERLESALVAARAGERDLLVRAIGFLPAEQVSDSVLGHLEMIVRSFLEDGRAIPEKDHGDNVLNSDDVGTGQDAVIGANPAFPVELSEAVEAVEALGRIGCSRSIDCLRMALDSDVDELRRSAAVALAACGRTADDGTAEKHLILRLDREESAKVRAALVRSLASMESSRLAERLFEILARRDEDDLVRAEALRALPALDPGRTIDGIVLALLDESETLRGMACLTMAEHRKALADSDLESRLKEEAVKLDGKPLQALALWALHRWRAICAGRGSVSEFSRRFDDFLVEYAEQAILSDPELKNGYMGRDRRSASYQDRQKKKGPGDRSGTR